jgi:hypothetical protein
MVVEAEGDLLHGIRKSLAVAELLQSQVQVNFFMFDSHR